MSTVLTPALHVPILVRAFTPIWAGRQFHAVLPLAQVKLGDAIALEEYAPTQPQVAPKSTGRVVHARCVGIDSQATGLKEGYCVAAIAVVSRVFTRSNGQPEEEKSTQTLSLLQIAARNGLEPPEAFAARQARLGNRVGLTTSILLSAVEMSQYQPVTLMGLNSTESQELWQAAQAMAGLAGIDPSQILLSSNIAAASRGVGGVMTFLDHPKPVSLVSLDDLGDLDPQVSDLGAS